MADPRPLTRDELAKFLPNQRAIRAFEKLFDLIPNDLESLAILIEELSVGVSDATYKANFALAASAFETSIQNSDYTTANSEKIICIGSITIVLNPSPDDDELVIVVATSGRIIVDGNGRNISGRDVVGISQNYTSLSVKYSIELNEWLIQ